HGDRAGGHALAADAMKTVAAGNEVARDLLRFAVGTEGHARRSGKDIVQRHVVSRVYAGRANRGAAVHQILGDLGLPVDHHRLAGELLEGDAVAAAVDANLHALVHEPVPVHAGADAGLVEQIQGDLFDDAGPDAAEDVFGGLPFQDDVIDAVLVQELAEQQARRPGADDDDFGAQDLCS